MVAREDIEQPAGNAPVINSNHFARIAEVRRIFSTITPRYDLMNHLLSAGRDISWRRFAITRLPAGTRRLLDLATGTADIALEAVRFRPGLQVCGLDLVPEMLKTAEQKIIRAGQQARIGLVRADALSLPFAEGSFDAAIIAFGMRNIPDHERLLKELRRVIRKGGRLLILEMTFPKKSILACLMRWYVMNMIPLLGMLLVRDRQAYGYLSESIRGFMTPEELSALLRRNGYDAVQAFSLTGGIAYLHEAAVL